MMLGPRTVCSALAIICAMVGITLAITPAIKSEYATSHISNTHNNIVMNTSLTALLAVKQAISGDPTEFLSLWNTSVLPDYCDWPGVYCSKNTHNVIALLLESNQLTGTLPPQLSQLSQLVYLNVSNNSFSGHIPSELTELSSLTHLDLSVNRLTGTIPSSLGNCTRLQYLDLRANALGGSFSSFLTSLDDLVYLDLSTNSFFGQRLPPDIGRLSNLQFLQLYGSSLTGGLPNSITNCTNLVWLDLGENSLAGPLPSDWSNLSKIFRIHLLNNFFTGSIPATLGNCTNLQNLTMCNNSLTGVLPESLGKLTMLQYLVLYDNNISGAIPASLVNCTLLISLQLSHNNLTGSIPSGIGQLKQVLWMTFNSNVWLSGEIPDTIGDCALLKILSVRFTQVGGPLPTSVYNLSSLQTLWLSSSRFSGSLSEAVKNLTAVTLLAFDSNAFVGRLPFGLGELTELAELQLQHNRFFGSIPPLLGSKSLYWIDLSYNYLTEGVPAALGQQAGPRLNHLYLQHNQLSGVLPDVLFRSLTGLLNLNLSHNNLTGLVPQSLHVGESLDLSFNNLTGTIPSSMGNMDMVSKIKLARNTLTGGIPDTFTGCHGLQVLDLSENILDGEIPSTTLGSMVVLEYLDLSHNRFYGALPQSLGGLLHLTFLNVSYNALEGMIPTIGIYKSSAPDAFAGNPGLCGYPLYKSCISHSFRHSGGRTTVIVSIVCSVGGILMVLLSIFLWWRSFSSSRTNKIPRDEFEEEWIGMQKPELLWLCTAEELRVATNGFHNTRIIGSGGASVCFKGMMKIQGSEKPVAIKRVRNETEAKRGFVQELKILDRVRHRNLVKGLGYCKEEEVVVLIMEFMEYGNLEELLEAREPRASLSWAQRLSIATDIAEGLVYLHHEFIQPIIHCDVKPKNILIGSDMVAKISDFGIAKVLLQDQYHQSGDLLCDGKFRGTFGYAAPECVAGSRIGTKADVYSYGILLIELLTGMKPTSPQLQEQGLTLHHWALGVLKSGHNSTDVGFLQDMAIKESIDKHSTILSQLEELLLVGVHCTNPMAKERPTIKDVRAALVKLTKPLVRTPFLGI